MGPGPKRRKPDTHQGPPRSCKAERTHAKRIKERPRDGCVRGAKSQANMFAAAAGSQVSESQHRELRPARVACMGTKTLKLTPPSGFSGPDECRVGGGATSGR